MNFHFPVIGISWKWIETLKTAALDRGIVETRGRFLETTLRPEKKKQRAQRTDSKHDQKHPEPTILLKPIHGICIGLRRSRWSS
jgi:hypothetical protein